MTNSPSKPLSLFTSPTGKSVISIAEEHKGQNYSMYVMYELSGESVEDLKWHRIDRNLPISGSNYVSFPITNNICADFVQKFNNLYLSQ